MSTKNIFTVLGNSNGIDFNSKPDLSSFEKYIPDDVKQSSNTHDIKRDSGKHNNNNHRSEKQKLKKRSKNNNGSWRNSNNRNHHKSAFKGYKSKKRIDLTRVIEIGNEITEQVVSICAEPISLSPVTAKNFLIDTPLSEWQSSKTRAFGRSKETRKLKKKISKAKKQIDDHYVHSNSGKKSKAKLIPIDWKWASRNLLVWSSPNRNGRLRRELKTEIDSMCKSVFVPNNAWFKMSEILEHIGWKRLLGVKKFNKTKYKLRCWFFCEFPGAFINATEYQFKKFIADQIQDEDNAEIATQFRWHAQSLNTDDGLSDSSKQLAKTAKHWDFGPEDIKSPGDITNINVLTYYVKNYSDTVNLATGDCGIDLSGNYDKQEKLSSRVVLAQTLVATAVAKLEKGIIVIKGFGMMEPASLCTLWFMGLAFDTVEIVKPKSSRPCNNEVYFVGIGKRKWLGNYEDDEYRTNEAVMCLMQIHFNNKGIDDSDKSVKEYMENSLLFGENFLHDSPIAESFMNRIGKINRVLARRQCKIIGLLVEAIKELIEEAGSSSISSKLYGALCLQLESSINAELD